MSTIKKFREDLAQKANELYRTMSWREDTRPYYVLVSEMMLQQTQVARVIPKFAAFVERFPDEKTLARAPLSDVLKLWQGLGYNRRAKYLHEAAKIIVRDFDGRFPDTEQDVLKLPGVGKNTAGAMMAYSFNLPSLFIETNIRTVYIHHFFADQHDITDKQIIEKLEKTIDRKHPREFYWALMDYGAWLKSSGVRNIAASKHFKKQSPLKGSVREVRGQIIYALSQRHYQRHELEAQFDDRLLVALDGLLREGLITESRGVIRLTDDGTTSHNR